MGLADHARLLLEYNEDANERVLEQAFSLDDATFEAQRDSSWGSVGGCLRHILMAQVVWLARWTKGPATPVEPASRDGLRAGFDASHAALRAFGATLTDAGWARVIEYTDSEGKAHALTLGILIPHLVNHGTLHRGEAGMLLAAHDRSPGDLDFVFFVLARQEHR